MTIGFNVLKKVTSLCVKRVTDMNPAKKLTHRDIKKLIQQSNRQVLLFKQDLGEQQESTVAVFYGPFPHPVAKTLGYDPHTYQVVCETGPDALQLKCCSKRIFTDVDSDSRIMIWTPASAKEAERLVKRNWGFEVELPSFAN